MFGRLTNADHHLEFFTKYGDASLIDAVGYVCGRHYPVVLFGYHYSSAFRITTIRTRDLQDGDWTVQFLWSEDGGYYHFSIWEGTSRGTVALPQRVCESSEFRNAIDELIPQMAGVDCFQPNTTEAEQDSGGQPVTRSDGNDTHGYNP